MTTTNGHRPANVPYQVAIGGVVYTLKLSMAAMIACEEGERAPDGTITPFYAIAARAGSHEMTAMRRVFWALLRAHHPDVTLEQAGELFLQARDEGVNVMSATDDGTPDRTDLQVLEATGAPAGRPRRRRRTGSAFSETTADLTGTASNGAAATPASTATRSSP